MVLRSKRECRLASGRAAHPIAGVGTFSSGVGGSLLGRRRSASKCAIPAQRKIGLDFSEGVTCFVVDIVIDVRSRLGPSFLG